MADQKITQLNALAAPSLDDLLVIVDDPSGTPETKKITALDLLFASGIWMYADITYDTPDLTTGVTIYTPAVGDILLAVGRDVTEAWDGSSPLGDFYTGSQPANPPYGFLSDDIVTSQWDMTEPVRVSNVVGAVTYISGLPSLAPVGAGTGSQVGVLGSLVFPSTDPLMFFVGQGGTSGNDPGASQGAARIHFCIARPLQSPG